MELVKSDDRYMVIGDDGTILCEEPISAAMSNPEGHNQYTGTGKDPRLMKPAHINKELDLLDESDGKLIDQMIDSGRGSETYEDPGTQD